MENRHSSQGEERESTLISRSFGVHGARLSCGSDFGVPLDLEWCSWVLSGVPQRKSSLLSCLMWNTELLWRKWRGIGHHLALKVESCGLPQVVGGNSCFLSSKYGDGSEPLMVSHGCQASFLVARDTLGFFSNCGRGIWTQLDLRRKYQHLFPVATAILRFV